MAVPAAPSSPLAPVRRQLEEAGFDLVFTFSVGPTNARLPREHQLPTFDRPETVGLLVGNTKAFFELFLARADLSVSDPLDAYVEQEVERAARLWGVERYIGFSHTRTPRPLAMQRFAHAAGFLTLGPAHLCVHPRVGPWCALRAIVVFDAAPAPDDLSPANEPTCEGCPRPCVPRLEDAIRGVLSDPSGPPEVSPEKAPWLALRDACPVGRAFRYEAPQLSYHYDKDRSVLEEAVTKRRDSRAASTVEHAESLG